MSENTREKYTIGIDFGTGSARAVIINVKTGELKASAMYVYPHDTMTEQLPDGTKLGKDYAYAVRLVCLSTILSILTMPVLVAVFCGG